MKFSTLTAALLATVALNSHADLINISSNGVHGRTLEAVSCGILANSGPTYRGYKILFIFSESMGNGLDPTLKVWSLRQNLVVTNDDWTGTYTINGEEQSPVGSSAFSLLRSPKKRTDSAVLYIAPPGEPVCISSNELTRDTSGLYQVNNSITDMTATLLAAGLQSVKISENETAQSTELNNAIHMIDAMIDKSKP